MGKKLLLIISVVSTLSLTLAAQTGAEIFKQCGTCHGDKGQKHSLNVTRFIAGLDKDEVVEILHEYKDGKRNKYGLGSMMKGQAGKLSDEQIDSVAEYVSSLPVLEDDREPHAAKEEIKDGAEIFKKCAICHGKNGEKHSLNVSKIIAGFDKELVKTILSEYKEGTRNSYGQGKMMKGQATKLTQEQMNAVAEYVSALPPVTEGIKEKAAKAEKDKISKEKVEYNRFLKEHFQKSTNPNETFEEAKRRWKIQEENKAKEEKPKPKAEDNSSKDEPAKPEAKNSVETEVNLDEIETAGYEEKESSWFSNIFN